MRSSSNSPLLKQEVITVTDDLEKSLQARPEQVVYANILEKGMLLGLLLVSGFVLHLRAGHLETVCSDEFNNDMLENEC